MNINEKTVLVGDIGGTNARFALVETDQPGFGHELTLQCADFAGIDRAIRHFLEHIGRQEPSTICLAIAGPIVDQQAQMTNSPWFISSADLSRQFPGAQVSLINDFTAIALSLPLLQDSDSLTIGPELQSTTSDRDRQFAVIGPGTGLGVAGLLQRSGRYLPLTSEAGHMGFAAETPQQIEILGQLRERWPRVSIERLLSGPGLENIHWALSHLNGPQQASLNAAEIFQAAQQDSASLAYQSVQVFFEVLGQVAGDIALAFEAHDGIYIAGGMVRRYPQLLARSQFRQAFENKGRHRVIMEDIPTRLIMHPQPGLLGSSYFALNPL